jgi:hypothetical protein
MAIRLHKENPALFQEAIRFTAAETGFAPRLIEKDYYCSVLLEGPGSSQFSTHFQRRHSARQGPRRLLSVE